MTFGDVDVKAGGTDTMRISVSSEVPIAAWQMKLYLPKGLTLAKNAAGTSYAYSLSPLYSKDFLFGVDPGASEQTPDDGCYTLVCFAKERGKSISGDDQELCTLTFKADQSYTDTDTIRIMDIHLSGRTAKNFQMGSVMLSNDPTGILDVKTDGRTEALYNLGGQRIDGVPRKGIYIRKGKKIIIK